MNCDYQPQANILQAMQQGRSFTVKEAWQYAGTTEMRRIASRLKKAGHNIQTRKEPGEPYVHYYLAEEVQAIKLSKADYIAISDAVEKAIEERPVGAWVDEVINVEIDTMGLPGTLELRGTIHQNGDNVWNIGFMIHNTTSLELHGISGPVKHDFSVDKLRKFIG